MNPTILFTFPPEAAAKIADFNSTRGEVQWTNILKNFETVLDVLPTGLEVKGTAGAVTLPTRIHAGIK